MTENGFGKWEGYVGKKENFNGVIFCLRESNVNFQEIEEFWFQEIVLREKEYFESLKEKSTGEDIRRTKQIAKKFKKRFMGILSQLGIEEDLSRTAFCNVNSRGGGSKVTGESRYDEALNEAPVNLKTAILQLERDEIIVFTCSDIYEKLKDKWLGKGICDCDEGIEYVNGKRGGYFKCSFDNKKIIVYKIFHPSRSPKVKGEKDYAISKN